jgi:hypothetical protein
MLGIINAQRTAKNRGTNFIFLIIDVSDAFKKMLNKTAYCERLYSIDDA